MSDGVEGLDDDVIDVESTEIVVRASSSPATLFHTDDPVEIISKATEVADALSDVLKKKGLTNRISNKDYVKVEGWTLCGTMLGVFPVVEWTRQVEGGWEARVEARTKDGSVVGAAEAECLRSESRWKTADDYSIRSMAQTRAISKALRAPLGFIVALAGYETTPEAEIGVEEPPVAREFDAEVDLVAGAMSGEDAPRVIGEALTELEPTVDWKFLMSDVTAATYGAAEWRELEPDDMQDFWRRLSNATFWMTELSPHGSMPPISAENIKKTIGKAFSGLVIEVPYVEPEPNDDDDAPLAGQPTIEDDDDIPFGE